MEEYSPLDKQPHLCSEAISLQQYGKEESNKCLDLTCISLSFAVYHYSIQVPSLQHPSGDFKPQGEEAKRDKQNLDQ